MPVSWAEEFPVDSEELLGIFGTKESTSRSSGYHKVMDDFAIDDQNAVFVVVMIEGQNVV